MVVDYLNYQTPIL